MTAAIDFLRRRSATIALVLAMLLVGAGCRAAPTTEQLVDAVDSPSVQDPLERLRLSTIRVLAHDVLVESGDRIEVGGSGFFIDADGYAVTNMHVISGAESLDVIVADRDEPVPASIVGVDECSDLALIKVDTPGDAFLEFRTDEVGPGLPVFAAGFPFTSAVGQDVYDYTLTNGIVNTLSGSGQTYSSSLDMVVEHSAKGRSGDSGGPVVDEQARVVGVTFFGADVDDINLAVDGRHAEAVVELLRSGSVKSIGVEGQAERSAVERQWINVLTVSAGTEASAAGVRPGDDIVTLGGAPVGASGKLTDYCEILKARAPGAPLDVEVFRPSTGETLVGSFGGAALEVISVDEASARAVPAGFVDVVDDTASLTLSVPTGWQFVGDPRNGADRGIYASPDLDAFFRGLAVLDVQSPGVFFEVLRPTAGTELQTVIDGSIDAQQFGARCASSFEREWAKEDGSLSGQQLIFDECDAVGATVVFLFASTADGATVLRLGGFSVDEPSAQAVEALLQTFLVTDVG